MSDAKNKPLEKKSETIEVRVSYSEKQAFMDACKETGTTASAAIRTHISAAVDPAIMREKRRNQLALLTLIFALAASALYFATKPAPLQPLSNSAQVMSYFDRDQDGLISLDDIANLNPTEQKPMRWLIEQSDSNNDGAMSLEEFEGLTKILIDFKATPNGGHSQAGAGPAQKIIVMPDNLSPEEQQKLINQHTNNMTLSIEERERLVAILRALAGPTSQIKSQPDSP